MTDTTLQSRIERAARHARVVKEKHVRDVKGKPGRTDILTLIEGWRGNEVVCAAFIPADRDRMLTVTHLVARGFGADMIAITLETYQVSGRLESEEWVMPDNPDTGKHWAQGELEQYFLKHGPGLVTESLMLTAWNRAGDELTQALPYKITRRVVDWVDWKDATVGDTVGIVPETMRQIMKEPDLRQVMREGFLSLGADDETRFAIADVAAVQAAQNIVEQPDMQGNHPPIMFMLFAEPGSKREQILRESFGRSMIQDPREWE